MPALPSLHRLRILISNTPSTLFPAEQTSSVSASDTAPLDCPALQILMLSPGMVDLSDGATLWLTDLSICTFSRQNLLVTLPITTLCLDRVVLLDDEEHVVSPLNDCFAEVVDEEDDKK